MGFFAVLAASLFAVFLFTVFGGYSLLLWCQQSLLMVVPPAVVLAVLVWTFLKMDDKITALQKRVEELEAAQKNAEESDLTFLHLTALPFRTRQRTAAKRGSTAPERSVQCPAEPVAERPAAEGSGPGRPHWRTRQTPSEPQPGRP